MGSPIRCRVIAFLKLTIAEGLDAFRLRVPDARIVREPIRDVRVHRATRALRFLAKRYEEGSLSFEMGDVYSRSRIGRCLYRAECAILGV